MDTIERMNNEIYKMEETILNLINEKVDLFDSQIIDASEKLDSILNEYNNLAHFN